MARNNMPVLTAEGGLNRYLDEIRKFPMLEPQEEYMLAKRYSEHEDRNAAHKLVQFAARLRAADRRPFSSPGASRLSPSDRASAHGRGDALRERVACGYDGTDRRAAHLAVSFHHRMRE